MTDPAYLLYLVPMAVAVIAVAAGQALLAGWSARRRTVAAVRTCSASLPEAAGRALEGMVAHRIRLGCVAYAVAAALAVPLIWFVGPRTAFREPVDGLTTVIALLVVVMAAGALTDLVTALPRDRGRSGRRVASLGVREVGRYLNRWERVAPVALVVLAAVTIVLAALRGSAGVAPALVILAGGVVVLALAEAVVRHVVRSPRPASGADEAVDDDVLVAVTVDRVAENGSSMGALTLLYVLVAVGAGIGIVATLVVGVVGVVLIWAITTSRSRRVAGRAGAGATA